MTFNDSIVYSTLGPEFFGVSLHRPDDPEGSLLDLPFWRGSRTERSSTEVAHLHFAGRERPVTSFGDQLSTVMTVVVAVPGSGQHDEQVDELRGYLARRELLVYRDGRGRVIFGSVAEQQVDDVRDGSTVTFTVTHNDFSEAV